MNLCDVQCNFETIENNMCPSIRGQLAKSGFIMMDYNAAVKEEVEVFYELLWKDFGHSS